MKRMIKNINVFSNIKGLTLVELLVAITLLGFVLTIATAMILPSYEIYDSSTRRMSASQLAELAKTEVSGYLRMAIDDEDKENKFGDDRDNWEFYGYHRDEGNDIVKYILSHNSDRLEIEVRNSENEEITRHSRMIVNNVKDFHIVEIDSNSLELYIEIDDGEKLAEKRITVNPRNF